MPEEAVFTMKLEPELRDAFMAEAEASHRPASQVVRDLMREFVERQRRFVAQRRQHCRNLTQFHQRPVERDAHVATTKIHP